MNAHAGGAGPAPQSDIERDIEAILAEYKRMPEDTIMVLQDVQAKYNWLPPDALAAVSSQLGVPLAQLYHIGSFYKAFALEPRGKHILQLCLGTACHVRGAALIADEMSRQWGIKLGKTSADKLITFERVNCLGACAIGPILVVDGEYKGNMTVNRANATVKKLKRSEEAKEGDNA
jgi:NADH-quinone oxidoreductase subunit E